ncbi:hypothetical protein AAMO2058_001551400 [Amorphochlora amoebiformis]
MVVTDASVKPKLSLILWISEEPTDKWQQLISYRLDLTLATAYYTTLARLVNSTL